MTKYILWCRDHPVFVITVLVIGTLFFGYQARNLQVDASAEGMMIEHDPSRTFYDGTIKLFGSDNISVVYVRDQDLFTYNKLKAVEEVFYNLEKIPGVQRVDGLFNTTNFKGVDGVLETNPLLDSVPEDPQALAKVREDALRSPLINKTLISPDGKGIAITVTADRNTKDRKFNIRIADEIDGAIAPLKEKVQQAFQVGMPMTRRFLSFTMINDQKKLLPLSIIVLLVMLVLGIRTINAGIVPLMTAGLSIIWTFGYMAMTGIPINVLTIIIPSLLIVIGSTEDMHMVAEYLENLGKTGNRLSAIERLAYKLGLTVFLTTLSNYLGFFSVTMNDITLLKQFGWASSFGFLFNSLISFAIVPVYLRYCGEKKTSIKVPEEGEEENDIFRRFGDWVVDMVYKYRKRILWGYSILTLIFLAGGFLVKMDNDLLSYFKPNSEIRVRSRQLHKELSGTQNFYMVFEAKGKDAFKDPENLKKLFKIQEYINQCGDFDASISLGTHIAFINREMSDGKKEEYRIPDTANLIPQYLLFFTREDLERYVSSDYSKANIIVRHNLSSSSDLMQALNRLEAFTRPVVGDTLTFKFTGEGVLINAAADSMANGQMASLVSMLVVIFIIMTVVFLRVKAGLLAMAPNVIPICMLFGVMGFFKIPLCVGTAMIADIAIGLAIDDTVHFMIRYYKNMKKLNDQKAALRGSLREEMNPVVTVSISLALGFLVMTTSNFVPLIYFGLLSALIMVFGLVTELCVTTSLLSYTQLITVWDMLSLKLRREVIKESPLFKNMGTWQTKKVVLMGHTREFPKDGRIIRQGDRERCMYMILEGKAKVERVAEDGKTVLLQELSPGDICGEIALVDEVERTANVTAEIDTRVLMFDWPSLERISKIFPMISSKFFLNISRVLGTRLARANVQLLQSQAKF